MGDTYTALSLTRFDTVSEINAAGINFISSPWNYFQVTSTRTRVGGLLDILGTLNVYGDAYKTNGGSWSTLSDSRIKEVKAPFTSSLEEILKLNPIVFEYTKNELKSKESQIGLIAQEAEKIAPFLVTEETMTFEDGETIDNLKVINPSPLIYMCINAIKDLHSEINMLKNRVKELESGPTS